MAKPIFFTRGKQVALDYVSRMNFDDPDDEWYSPDPPVTMPGPPVYVSDDATLEPTGSMQVPSVERSFAAVLKWMP